MHPRNIETPSEYETPEQTYQKAFEQRVHLVNAIKDLETQKHLLQRLSLEHSNEHSKKWEIIYSEFKKELSSLDLSLNDWLTHYPHLASHNSLNSILQSEQLNRSQISNSNPIYANSSATLFSMSLSDFHPGVSTKLPAEKSAHRQHVKIRR